MSAYRIEATLSSVLNYSLQQNHVSFLKDLIVYNDTDADVADAQLKITSEPAFVLPYTKPLLLLPSGQGVNAGLLDLKISPDFLANLTERLSGLLSIEISKNGATLHSETLAVDVLAYDQWSGLGFLPELIAAFVAPNHAGIAKLIKQASEILGQWTGNPSLDSYQSNDPNRVKQQVAAVYAVLQGLNITYCEPPASFEAAGQRIRMNAVLLEQRMGTCIDTTLLFASCLEAMGLHPLILFTKGHAFPGAWLENECFHEAVQDDLSALTKRVASGINSICVVETTAATAGKSVGFNEAEAMALNHLSKQEDFELVVDIKRARAAFIRPLPERVRGESGWETAEETIPMDAAQPGMLDAAAVIIDGRVQYTKQQQWERRLLDLSLRNTLVSLRLTKNVIPLLAAGMSELEDALSSGDEFQVLEKPQDWESLRDMKLFEHSNLMNPYRELLKFEFEHKRLRAPLTAAELSAAMTGLYRTARVSLEENGANTLYMTLGLLKWYETPASQKPRYAPLALIPVEIVRKSAVKGYIIRLRDEEPQMNITLLEMLKQDFGLNIGGLDPLPADEKGVDIKAVFSIMRQAVMNRSGWDVLEEAFLGIFSFSQFVMWNDIRNRARDLAASKVVSSLISGKLEWQPQPMSCGQDALDSACAPGKVFLPIAADASQLEAVSASGEGRSFVLHGPPGTGKSQTITNIIANSLANGKSVLFVAEKMAALSVVQRRLEAIGIGPFCLELHSNKSKKKDVLEQLRLTTEATRTQPPQDFALQAERLAAQRQDLNGYVEALHRQQAFGMSLYDAISGYGNNGRDQEISCRQDEFQTLTRNDMDMRLETVESLVAAARNTGHPSGHPLHGIRTLEYSQSLRTAASVTISEFIAAVDCADLRLSALSAALAMDLPKRVSNLKALAAACMAAVKLAGVPAALLCAPDVQTTVPQVIELINHGQAMAAARYAVLSVYREDILSTNGGLLLDEWQQASMKWFLPKAMEQNRIAKLLQLHCIAGKVDKNQLEGHLKQLVTFQAEQKKVEAILLTMQQLLGGWWQGHNTNWDSLRQVCGLLSGLDTNLQAAVASPVAARQAMVKPGNTAPAGEFVTAWQALEDKQTTLTKLLVIDFSQYNGAAEYLAAVRQNSAAWLQHLDGLREWVGWNVARSHAFSCGLALVVSAYEQGMQHDCIPAAYLKGRWHAAAEWIISQNTTLGGFSGAVFMDKVRQFKKTDDLFEQLTRQEVYARLASRVPNFTVEASQNSELGILQRAIRSGGRGIAIRKLFELIPNLLPRLCPCMLMSPISVAQYLDTKHAPFDLVVFDEASQLPTCKAVGAIARGRDVIVVGDPKQLPPTSFFATNTSDEEDFEIEDLESILDDCLALSMPQSSLLWHYRSRHESLIAFSNSSFYDNTLLTFPSPHDLVSCVRLVPVGGSYDRGKTKQNRAEAEAVVGEIIRRLSDETLRRKSIGVVTFSSVQQNLIDDLLTAAFIMRPDLEEAAMQGLEPLFIKNLENVQGDERDIILFSVGYGPDENGKVTLNFGPLNREGGWRRLNVAVSRAREEMIVYSTLRPDQLDASRTTARGVADLKAFLEYAQSGKRVIGSTQAKKMQEAQGIEKQIAAALSAEGFTVNTNIGCSGYRVTAAVVHPDKPGEYILGILCDGAIYRSARTARDRELAQEAVLGQLGWNIQRVWALDWWDSPAKETRKLVSLLRELLTSKGTGGSGPAPEQSKISTMAAPLPAAVAYAPAPVPAVADTMRKLYVPVKLTQNPLSADEFCLPQYASHIARKVAQTVNAEGPVSFGLLCYRVLQSFGISRMGSRIEQTLRQVIAGFSFTATLQEGMVFYWPNDIASDGYECYRMGDTDDSRRDAEDLPVEEVACAAKAVLQQQIGLPIGDLARETAKFLGYVRMGPALEQAMRLGIGKAVNKGWLVNNGGNVSISSKMP